MARKFLVPIDLSKNELQNAVVQNLAGAPSSPATGQVYVETTGGVNRLYVYNGAAWVLKATDSDLLQGQNSAYHLARANHTGTQLAATVSDFDTQVRTSRLDQMATPTADVAWGSHKITGVLDPTGAQDAATKAYVDATAQGLDPKPSVRVATTANITLTAAQTIDGVSAIAGDRVLVKDQTTGSQNGIYLVASGSWTRSTDADTSAEVTAGMFVFVEEGTVQADTGWVLTTNNPITLATTALTFAQFSSAAVVLGGAGLVKTGNTLDVVAASGSGIIANADNIDLDPTNGVPINRGGTAAITAAGAKTSLGFMTRYATSIGDGAAVSYTVTHSLGTTDVIVQVFLISSGAEVMPDITRTTTNAVVIAFTVAPTTNQYRVVVIG